MAEISSDILLFCQKTIQSELEKLTRCDINKKIHILRRSKDLKRGDFLAIVQSWKCSQSRHRGKVDKLSKSKSQASHKHVTSTENTVTDSDLIESGLSAASNGNTNKASNNSTYSEHENRKKEIESLTFDGLSPFKASVCELTENSDILIKLQRPQVIKSAISAVDQAGCRYGMASSSSSLPRCLADEGRVLINVADLLDNADWPGFSVSHLRSMLLSEHVGSLLRAAGLQVDFMPHGIQSKWRQMIQDFSIDTEHYQVKAADDPAEHSLDSVMSEIDGIFRNSRHFVEADQQQSEAGSCDMACVSQEPKSAGRERPKSSDDGEPLNERPADINPTVISLKSFVQSCDSTDMHIYDKNINLADFSLGTERLQDLAYLEKHRRSQQMNSTICDDVMIHITPQEKSFYLQTLDLGWQIISNGTSSRQVHLVHGPVNSRGGQMPIFKAHDLLELRRKQMESASELKYGDLVQGPGWDSTIEALTIAGIKFEILSTTCRQPVKLDVSVDADDVSMTMDKRGGVFVMYNCARLSTLFSNYSRAVQQGMYPPLPEAETLDFSLLRGDEEWLLVFNYLIPYPSLIQECVASLNQPSKPQLHLHKVSQFLQELSRDLSSYYSRVHVLGEPRSHLFPVMFCRLYLLKAIQQVMHNALQLLCINPLSQL